MNRIIFTLGGKCQHEVRVREIIAWQITDAIAAGYCFSSCFLAGPLLDITFFVVFFCLICHILVKHKQVSWFVSRPWPKNVLKNGWIPWMILELLFEKKWQRCSCSQWSWVSFQKSEAFFSLVFWRRKLIFFLTFTQKLKTCLPVANKVLYAERSEET